MPYIEQLLYQTEISSHRRFSIKTAVQNFAIFQENTYVGVSATTLLKKTPAQVFYHCEIFKNIHFLEHQCTAAPELTLESDCLELCF